MSIGRRFTLSTSPEEKDNKDAPEKLSVDVTPLPTMLQQPLTTVRLRPTHNKTVKLAMVRNEKQICF